MGLWSMRLEDFELTVAGHAEDFELTDIVLLLPRWSN